MAQSAKGTEIACLLKLLREERRTASGSADVHMKTLQRLKVLGREPKDADEIYTRSAIGTLSEIGVNGDSVAASREALGCLANALLLHPPTRQVFIDLGFADRIADKYQGLDDFQLEFLYARILLLLTYSTKLDYGQIMEGHRLAESLLASLDRHVQVSSTPEEEMALSEALKLAFNLMHHSRTPELFSTPALPRMLKLLDARQPTGMTARTAVASAIVNILLYSELPPSTIFPASDPEQYVTCLLNVLEAMLRTSAVQELDASASPVVTLLRKLLETAPDIVKTVMQARLLPSAQDRHRPLGQSETLPSRLLRTSVSGYTPILRDSIPHLLFELSDRDVEKFVKNVGYGYASGFLTNNKIPAPAADTKGEGGTEDDINFVTGQYVRDQTPDNQPPMTEEEKMQEAERLFVLFERLKKNGVMKVQNPVEAAVESGRFEELD